MNSISPSTLRLRGQAWSISFCQRTNRPLLGRQLFPIWCRLRPHIRLQRMRKRTRRRWRFNIKGVWRRSLRSRSRWARRSARRRSCAARPLIYSKVISNKSKEMKQIWGRDLWSRQMPKWCRLPFKILMEIFILFWIKNRNRNRLQIRCRRLPRIAKELPSLI